MNMLSRVSVFPPALEKIVAVSFKHSSILMQ
jgi:hypothetical protein